MMGAHRSRVAVCLVGRAHVATEGVGATKLIKHHRRLLRKRRRYTPTATATATGGKGKGASVFTVRTADGACYTAQSGYVQHSSHLWRDGGYATISCASKCPHPTRASVGVA